MTKKSASSDDLFHDVIKSHWGHIVALLTNLLNDLELAEDAMQDALESALIHWRNNGLPKKPQAWLFITAKHKALDKIRRDKVLTEKLQKQQYLIELNFTDKSEESHTIPDERLRLIFACCHQALKPSISVALTLKLLGGMSTAEIAKAFLVKTETLAQRIVRGKRKIKQKIIPYVIPAQEEFVERLDRVLMVLYLIFNEGYFALNSVTTMKFKLCNEAIRLTKILVELCPKEQEAKGLLALMLIHDSRKKARFDKQGKYVVLEFQDRRLWNKQQKELGTRILETVLKQKHIGNYQLQATISAIYSDAENYNSTNWQELTLVYDELYKINPSPVVKLNQLVVLSKIEPFELVIKKLKSLESELENYQPFYAVTADLLAKVGRKKEAQANYKKAIKLCENIQIKEFLTNKCRQLN